MIAPCRAIYRQLQARFRRDLTGKGCHCFSGSGGGNWDTQDERLRHPVISFREAVSVPGGVEVGSCLAIFTAEIHPLSHGSHAGRIKWGRRRHCHAEHWQKGCPDLRAPPQTSGEMRTTRYFGDDIAFCMPHIPLEETSPLLFSHPGYFGLPVLPDLSIPCWLQQFSLPWGSSSKVLQHKNLGCGQTAPQCYRSKRTWDSASHDLRQRQLEGSPPCSSRFY